MLTKSDTPIYDGLLDEMSNPEEFKEEKPTKRERHKTNLKAQRITDEVCRELGFDD